jgi:hypothetical protein
MITVISTGFFNRSKVFQLIELVPVANFQAYLLANSTFDPMINNVLPKRHFKALFLTSNQLKKGEVLFFQDIITF